MKCTTEEREIEELYIDQTVWMNVENGFAKKFNFELILEHRDSNTKSINLILNLASPHISEFLNYSSDEIEKALKDKYIVYDNQY